MSHCQGCGAWFKNERGLRAHQSGKFVTMACRPIRKTCICMVEDAGDGTERVLTHSLSCPLHPEYECDE
jgi:hypothetical protein